MLKIIKRTAAFVLILIGAALCTFGYARFVEPNLLTGKSFTIETKKDIEACNIVFFTDTHFGKYYDEDHMEKIAAKINAAEADVVIFGGDLIDNYARDLESLDLEAIQAGLAKIEAKKGKFAVWGNHDYGGGAVRVYEDLMSAGGFELLKNESRLLEDYGIRVIGYDDYLMGWTDPSLYRIESDAWNLIVSHEPVISRYIESESENFMLAGHTHGGQVSIPFLTSRLLPEGSGEFVKGLYNAEEIGTDVSLQMYTSSGIGMTRYPARFLNMPEIVEIHVRKE